ncbi:MAG TPA: HlyC/CorC family transporter [Candidatus Choladousia intestinigallinarum]|nr:HlyC/CorC family transporter [Candidatus Choladousia intestinigallinarum]
MIGAILLQILLIFLNATFASAEIAVLSMNETKLKKMAEDGDKRARKLKALTEQPARFLSTIQIAITLSGFLGSAYAADNFAGHLANLLVALNIPAPRSVLNSVSVFLITIILSYFSLVFGELVPKRVAMKKSEALSLGMSGMLYGISKIFWPIVFLLTASTNLVLRLMGIDPEEEDEQVSEEEIRMMLAAGNEQGTIDAEENEMIQNVFEFDDITAGQICTHRIDVISLDVTDSAEDWREIIYEQRHTLYPVCDGSVDDVIGILDTKDYFRSSDQSKEYLLEHAVDQPYFVPESMKANVLFRNMKQNRTYFAVVIDEYGGLSGIVTLHDLMETLVGDLYEIEEPAMPEEIEQTGENQWCIYGSAELDDVADALGVELPVDEYDTYSGFICGEIGRVPKDGENFEVESHGLKIQVHSVESHVIGKTTVEVLPQEKEEDEPERA